MSEYISRDTILKVLAGREPKEEDWRIDNADNYNLRKIRFLAASNVYEEIKDVLSCKRLVADVAPVVHGYWKANRKLCMPECSVCEARPFIGYIPSMYEVEKTYKYCPNCGAKMDESEGEE